MGAKPSSDTLASSPEGRASFSPEATRRASVADATIRDRSVLGFVLGFAAALAHIVPSVPSRGGPASFRRLVDAAHGASSLGVLVRVRAARGYAFGSPRLAVFAERARRLLALGASVRHLMLDERRGVEETAAARRARETVRVAV